MVAPHTTHHSTKEDFWKFLLSVAERVHTCRERPSYRTVRRRFEDAVPAIWCRAQFRVAETGEAVVIPETEVVPDPPKKQRRIPDYELARVKVLEVPLQWLIKCSI